MTVAELLQVLSERNAVFYVEGDRLRYKGPRRTPDDPIRKAIDIHRAELIELFTPRPGIRPDESFDTSAGGMLESQLSAGACVFCPSPLAAGDPIVCVACRERLSVTATDGWDVKGVTLSPIDGKLSVTSLDSHDTVAVTSASAMSPADLLVIAELRGWEALPIRRGESAGGSEEAWRTFVGWARGETLHLALAAAWERWRESVEQYGQLAAPATPGGTTVEQAGHFEPSHEWQEVPDGYPCPPGGEFRMDFQTGKNWGRWREPAQAVAGGEE